MSRRTAAATCAVAGTLVAMTAAMSVPAAAGPAEASTVDATAGAGESFGIVPEPVSTTALDGAPFVLTPDAVIVAPGQAADEGELLAQILRASTGYELPVVASGDGDITLALGETVPGYEGEAEAYRLRADAGGVVVAAADDHGLFNGVQTLRQLFPTFAESRTVVETEWTVPAVEVVDAPRFDHRGIQLDVARSFLTVEEVKQHIDALAQYKMSALHLHLADDQGWRIEITNEGRAEGDTIDYTRLTSISGQTAMTEWGYQDEPGRTGFYTQRDYAEIVAYAAERHIEVIPEIDMPGHTNAALHAIPELNTEGAAPEPDPATGTVPANGTGQVGYSTLDTDSEVTYTFVEHVLTQLAALTPGRYIHIGGDESHVTAAEDYVRFIERVIPMVEALGKQPIGWTEYANADLRAGNVVQHWVGSAAKVTDRVLNNGAEVVVSLAARSYIDQKYSPETPIGLTWACRPACDVDRYYAWDPTDVVPGVPEASIRGVEAPLWSETVRGVEQAQFLVLPRAIANLEIGWSQQADRDLEGFLARLAGQGGRLTLQGHNFFDTPTVEWAVEGAALPAQSRPGRKAPAVDLAVVTAPGTTAEQLDVTVTWSDGTTTPATLTTDRVRDPLHAAGAYVVSTQRNFMPPDAPFTATVTVTAPHGRVEIPVEVSMPWDGKRGPKR